MVAYSCAPSRAVLGILLDVMRLNNLNGQRTQPKPGETLLPPPPAGMSRKALIGIVGKTGKTADLDTADKIVAVKRAIVTFVAFFGEQKQCEEQGSTEAQGRALRWGRAATRCTSIASSVCVSVVVWPRHQLAIFGLGSMSFDICSRVVWPRHLFAAWQHVITVVRPLLW